jgi:tetratricopeptide (TPR) repeat protein
MKKFLLSLFVIFLAYFTAYHTSGAAEKQDLFDFGNSPFMYKIKCAITGETDTTNANELYYRAGGYMDMEEYELAIKDYKKVIELDPDIAYTRIDLANAYLAINDTSSAIMQYRQHIASSDFPEDAYLELGIIYQKKGLLDSTAFYYNKVIEANSQNHEILYKLATYYFNTKEYDRALNSVNKAIDGNLYDLNYRNLLRKIYIKLEQYESAEAEYQYIVTNDPDYFGNYEESARKAKEEGEFQKAIENYNLALEIKPDDVKLLNERGWVYHSLLKYDSALIDFKHAANITPDYYNFFNIAYTLDVLDSIDEAINYYNKSLELKSDYYLSYNNRGYEYYRLKKYTKAIKDYSMSIELKKDYYLSYYNRGLTYFELKKYTKAIRDYKMAQRLTKDNLNIIYDIALAYDKVRNRKEAIFYFNEYLKSAESDSTKIDYAIERVAKLSK